MPGPNPACSIIRAWMNGALVEDITAPSEFALIVTESSVL
jgi:hypothetical protein